MHPYTRPHTHPQTVLALQLTQYPHPRLSLTQGTPLRPHVRPTCAGCKCRVARRWYSPHEPTQPLSAFLVSPTQSSHSPITHPSTPRASMDGYFGPTTRTQSSRIGMVWWTTTAPSTRCSHPLKTLTRATNEECCTKRFQNHSAGTVVKCVRCDLLTLLLR